MTPRPRRAVAAADAAAVAKTKAESAKAAAAAKKAEEDEKAKAEAAEAAKAIGGGSLDGGGKLNPQQGLPGGSGIVVTPPKQPKSKAAGGVPKVDETYATKVFVPIMKVLTERRTITGVVLEPDTVDAHKDTIPADVILDAAEDFLANINITTTLGLMHKDLKPPLELVQSFVVSDSDITINSVLVLRGSWVITVRVNDDAIWQDIKDGKLTGFSIGGKATVQSLEPEAAA